MDQIHELLFASALASSVRKNISDSYRDREASEVREVMEPDLELPGPQ